MTTIKHPNIIEMYTHFEDESNIYLVLELAEGLLYTKLKENRKLEESTVAKYMKDIIYAIHFLHTQTPPIIHRDIKPENILIVQDKIKITDFGWSNINDSDRDTYCGTPDYLAPEMIQEIGHNEKLDIWTLGVLMYELLVGKAPFTPTGGKDTKDKMKLLEDNILNMNITFPADFPAKAENMILKMLMKNPSIRPSAKELQVDEWFDDFFDGNLAGFGSKQTPMDCHQQNPNFTSSIVQGRSKSRECGSNSNPSNHNISLNVQYHQSQPPTQPMNQNNNILTSKLIQSNIENTRVITHSQFNVSKESLHSHQQPYQKPQHNLMGQISTNPQQSTLRDDLAKRQTQQVQQQNPMAADKNYHKSSRVTNQISNNRTSQQVSTKANTTSKKWPPPSPNQFSTTNNSQQVRSSAGNPGETYMRIETRLNTNMNRTHGIRNASPIYNMSNTVTVNANNNSNTRKLSYIETLPRNVSYANYVSASPKHRQIDSNNYQNGNGTPTHMKTCNLNDAFRGVQISGGFTSSGGGQIMRGDVENGGDGFSAYFDQKMFKTHNSSFGDGSSGDNQKQPSQIKANVIINQQPILESQWLTNSDHTDLESTHRRVISCTNFNTKSGNNNGNNNDNNDNNSKDNLGNCLFNDIKTDTISSLNKFQQQKLTMNSTHLTQNNIQIKNYQNEQINGMPDIYELTSPNKRQNATVGAEDNIKPKEGLINSITRSFDKTLVDNTNNRNKKIYFEHSDPNKKNLIPKEKESPENLFDRGGKETLLINNSSEKKTGKRQPNQSNTHKEKYESHKSNPQKATHSPLKNGYKLIVSDSNKNNKNTESDVSMGQNMISCGSGSEIWVSQPTNEGFKYTIDRMIYGSILSDHNKNNEKSGVGFYGGGSNQKPSSNMIYDDVMNIDVDKEQNLMRERYFEVKEKQKKEQIKNASFSDKITDYDEKFHIQSEEISKLASRFSISEKELKLRNSEINDLKKEINYERDKEISIEVSLVQEQDRSKQLEMELLQERLISQKFHKEANSHIDTINMQTSQLKIEQEKNINISLEFRQQKTRKVNLETCLKAEKDSVDSLQNSIKILQNDYNTLTNQYNELSSKIVHNDNGKVVNQKEFKELLVNQKNSMNINDIADKQICIMNKQVNKNDDLKKKYKLLKADMEDKQIQLNNVTATQNQVKNDFITKSNLLDKEVKSCLQILRKFDSFNMQNVSDGNTNPDYDYNLTVIKNMRTFVGVLQEKAMNHDNEIIAQKSKIVISNNNCGGIFEGDENNDSFHSMGSINSQMFESCSNFMKDSFKRGSDLKRTDSSLLIADKSIRLKRADSSFLINDKSFFGELKDAKTSIKCENNEDRYNRRVLIDKEIGRLEKDGESYKKIVLFLIGSFATFSVEFNKFKKSDCKKLVEKESELKELIESLNQILLDISTIKSTDRYRELVGER